MSRRTAAVLLAILAVAITAIPIQGAAQSQSSNDDLVRRAKTKVEPIYPDLARKMRLAGTVKVEVTVAPNGIVKEARIIGGHPVLANAALDAARKWRFEPAPAESTGIIDFKFDPH